MIPTPIICLFSSLKIWCKPASHKKGATYCAIAAKAQVTNTIQCALLSVFNPVLSKYLVIESFWRGSRILSRVLTKDCGTVSNGCPTSMGLLKEIQLLFCSRLRNAIAPRMNSSSSTSGSRLWYRQKSAASCASLLGAWISQADCMLCYTNVRRELTRRDNTHSAIILCAAILRFMWEEYIGTKNASLSKVDHQIKSNPARRQLWNTAEEEEKK